MRTPSVLRNLDDRVLGRRHRTEPASGHADTHARQPDDEHPDVYPDDRTEPPREPRGRQHPQRRPAGDVARRVVGVVWRVLRLALLLLALVVALGIVLTFLPTNDDNVIVRTVLDLAERAAGPFRDVFTADTARRELLYNYALATGVYLLAASLVGRLPGARSTTG